MGIPQLNHPTSPSQKQNCRCQLAPTYLAMSKSHLTRFSVPLHLKPHYMEAEIGKNAWFAGNEFTAADIQISFPLEAATALAGLNASRPKLMAFLNRIHTRPAYQQALERGGAYTLLS